MRLDETTYEPVRPAFKGAGRQADGQGPSAAWAHEAGAEGGRFFYTELGHDLRSLDTPFGRRTSQRRSAGRRVSEAWSSGLQAPLLSSDGERQGTPAMPCGLGGAPAGRSR